MLFQWDIPADHGKGRGTTKPLERRIFHLENAVVQNVSLHYDQNVFSEKTLWFLLREEEKEEYNLDILRCSAVDCVFWRLLFSSLSS